jgi:outer membrane usher protein
VVSDLQSYQVRRVITEMPNLPPGYEVGPDYHTLRPTYKSGTVVRVGTEANVSLAGLLEDGEGQPVPLQAGELVDPQQPSRKPLSFFTNRRGRFYVEGARSGSWELRLFAAPEAAVKVEVPKDKVGLLDLGTLKLPVGVRLR